MIPCEATRGSVLFKQGEILDFVYLLLDSVCVYTQKMWMPHSDKDRLTQAVEPSKVVQKKEVCCL